MKIIKIIHKYGHMITEFSAKELIQDEPDASSFPSGGFRQTFEARGYNAWDYSSHVFLKESNAGVTLCIPSVFCSYNGEVLDRKASLLKSTKAINKETIRALKEIFKIEAQKIIPSVALNKDIFWSVKVIF